MTGSAVVPLRDIVHLGTGTVIGWAIDRVADDGDAVSRFRLALSSAVARTVVSRPSARTFALVPVPAEPAVLDLLMRGPADLDGLAPVDIATRLVFEFAGADLSTPRVLETARNLVASGFRVGLALDERLAGLDALSAGAHFDVVRCARVPDGNSPFGRMVMTVARQLADEGCEVVVDGIADRHVADRLRRDGIALGQGPLFDHAAGGDRRRDRPDRSAPVPANEQERMALLMASHVLDTAPEPHFDFVVETAAARCAVPISLLSIVDSDRQWFKASVGLDVAETPREWALCAHTVCGSEPLQVIDAAADPRFWGNPLVVGRPYIRAYLGVPLLATTGVAFGSLCVIDVVPRGFDDGEVRALCGLARLAAAAIELRSRRDPVA